MKQRRKRLSWALYENLRQIEREAAFRLLKWAVNSLPPWDSRWKGIGRKPYDAGALTVVTIWQEIEGKPERAYTAGLERDKERLHLRARRERRHTIHQTEKEQLREGQRLQTMEADDNPVQEASARLQPLLQAASTS